MPIRPPHNAPKTGRASGRRGRPLRNAPRTGRAFGRRGRGRPLRADGDLYPFFREALRRLGVRPSTRLLVACSGGPDSMTLWDLAERRRAETGAFVGIVHVEHGLRNRASRADAAFVRARARALGAPCRVLRASVRSFARRERRGLEEAARILRYRALARAARRWRCEGVLTAHTRDDQVETVFLNLLRGSGPAGLTGMAPLASWPVAQTEKIPERTAVVRPETMPGQKIPGKHQSPLLLRPLLDVDRGRILAYLRKHRLSYRIDTTNRLPIFLRNRLRPILRRWERLRPGFHARVAQTTHLLREEEAWWRRRLARAAGTVLRRKGRSVTLDLRRFKRYHRVEQRRILRHLLGLTDFTLLERIRALAKASVPGRHDVPGGRVDVSKDSLVFHRDPRPVATSAASRRPIPASRLSVPGRVFFRSGDGSAPWEVRARRVRRLPKDWRRNPWLAHVDADRLGAGPLTCQPWRNGDRFRPLGLAGTKKLQDFFVDEGVPAGARRRLPVLAGRHGIVWVAGHRIADAVKLTPATRRIVQLAARRVRHP